MNDRTSEDAMRVVPRYFVDPACSPVAKRRADRLDDGEVVTSRMLQTCFHATTDRFDNLLGERAPDVGHLAVSLEDASCLSCLRGTDHPVDEKFAGAPSGVEARTNRSRDALGHLLARQQGNCVA